MAPASKDKLIQIIITIVSAFLAAGGGSYAVNNDLSTRVAINEVKIAEMQTDGDKILAKLDKLEVKIESGQAFVRDEIGQDITDLKVDVATLKARR